MPTRRREVANTPLPSPFPEGWYFIASRQEIRKARLIQKTWMGENIIVWCDENGQVCVAEAFCPHLGADLGPEAGGRVCAGRLVCPFHGFEYDATGQCVATPYADPPRTAKLQVFETKEILGMIFAWYGIEGREPQWNLPAELPDQAGWSGLEIRTLRFPGHPQETTENSVDLAHLRYVHGYDSVNRIGRISVDGASLESNFDFVRTRTFTGGVKFTLDLSANTLIFGLGYSFVKIRERSIGMDLRLWVLATPVDGALIDFTLVSQVREIRKPKRWIAGLGFLSVRLRTILMNKILAYFQLKDVLQDVVIWRHKQYRSRPRLCRSDGEIMPYRAYCAQFYADQRYPQAPSRRRASPAGAASDTGSIHE